MVRAHNEYGFGDWSSTTDIVASDIPDAPSAPTVAINNLNVRITWSEPGDNFEAIDYYSILILASDTSSYTELTYCDGTDQDIID
mmetsp:Transcript_33988/g.25077  ORF Transcript_33988/g.25077 Transcript_33988/m.25077 type:complete len:85 (+) Transcript_33988:155-409(+)